MSFLTLKLRIDPISQLLKKKKKNYIQNIFKILLQEIISSRLL